MVEMLTLISRAMIGVSSGFQLGSTELVVRINEHIQNSVKSLQTAKKTTTVPCQSRDKVPEIGVDAFDNMRIGLIAYITDVLSRVDHIQVCNIPVSGVSFRVGCGVNDSLNCPSRLVSRHRKTQNLSGLTANQQNKIYVFPRLRLCFLSYEPVQLI